MANAYWLKGGCYSILFFSSIWVIVIESFGVCILQAYTISHRIASLAHTIHIKLVWFKIRLECSRTANSMKKKITEKKRNFNWTLFLLTDFFACLLALYLFFFNRFECEFTRTKKKNVRNESHKAGSWFFLWFRFCIQYSQDANDVGFHKRRDSSCISHWFAFFMQDFFVVVI